MARTSWLKIRAEGEELERWAGAARMGQLGMSEWVRAVLNRASELGRFAPKSGESREEFERDRFGTAGPVAEPQKISNSGVEVKEAVLPRATPVRRRHINLREDAQEEQPPERVRCTYLWPSRSKKCPRCGRVHSDV